MEITKSQTLRLIRQSIISNRAKAINAVRLSDVDVNNNISNAELFKVVLSQLEAGNKKLIYNFGYVLDDTFDMDVVNENFSGFSFSMSNPDDFNKMNTNNTPTKSASKQNSWWSQNKGNILTTGVGLLGNIFGGSKDDAPAVTPPAANGSNAMMLMMQQQQQQQSQAAALAAQQAQADSARRSSNMMIFGVIGGVVVIGGILAVVLTRK